MRDIYLSQFKPVSELKVEEHLITKPKFPVIDFHTHYGPARAYKFNLDSEMTSFKNYGVVGIVNLDGFWGDRLESAFNSLQSYSDMVITFGNVDVSRLDEPDFSQYVASTLETSYKQGIKGLKFFKDLSLVEKDSKGNYIPVDDPRLQPIWDTAARLQIPVLIHIADPVAFFKPIDEKNERFEELNLRSDWSFYRPELFSYEELMEQQENLLTNYPETTFVITHMGSAAENLSFVADQLDRHSNMYVDMAARIAELGRQPYTTRKFFLEYQDRVLFSTDITPGRTDLLPYYYRFLETWDEYFDYCKPPCLNGRWKIYGIGLPDDVLEKIYNKNALKLVPEFSRCFQ